MKIPKDMTQKVKKAKRVCIIQNGVTKNDFALVLDERLQRQFLLMFVILCITLDLINFIWKIR